MEQQNKRLNYLDVCKGIAILMVVICHCCTDHYYEVPFHQYMGTAFGYIHNPMFFIVSGYLLGCKNSIEPFKGFLVKKVQRLLVPFWVFSLAYWIEMAFFKMISGREWLPYLKENLIHLVDGLGGVFPGFFLLFLSGN